MSQYPPPQQVPPSQPGPMQAPQPSPVNGLGIAGFVVSLVGLLGFCTAPLLLLSVLGTILSAVGMRRQPRGLAIAGFVIGLIGCIWLLIVALVIGGVMTVGLMGGLGLAQGMKAERAAAATVVAAAQAYKTDKGTYPPDIDALVKDHLLSTVPLDALGHEMYLKLGTSDTIEVWSPGRDEINGTGDDRELGSSRAGPR